MKARRRLKEEEARVAGLMRRQAIENAIARLKHRNDELDRRSEPEKVERQPRPAARVKPRPVNYGIQHDAHYRAREGHLYDLKQQKLKLEKDVKRRKRLRR